MVSAVVGVGCGRRWSAVVWLAACGSVWQRVAACGSVWQTVRYRYGVNDTEAKFR